MGRSFLRMGSGDAESGPWPHGSQPEGLSRPQQVWRPKVYPGSSVAGHSLEPQADDESTHQLLGSLLPNVPPKEATIDKAKFHRLALGHLRVQRDARAQGRDNMVDVEDSIE